MRTADGYVRVSRVAGRSGENFISPDEQRAAIEAWAKSTKTTILEWHEDLDQSGGTLDRPAFNVALDRCRSGLTGGIVAAKLGRLTRSVAGLGSLIEDAKEHGYNLVAVDFGLDFHSPNGKLVANVLGSVAEWERERRAVDWDAARRNSVARGVPNGRAPIGYVKRPDGRLEIDEPKAKLVREAFRLRTEGVPFAAIGRPNNWSHTTTMQILRNEAYVGVARSGKYRLENAHPPIVSAQDFDAAQSATTIRPAAKAGTTTSGRLLKGLARCGGCGRTLKVVTRRRADGSPVPAYYCKNAAADNCTGRAYVHCDELDAHIEEWFADALRSAPRMIDVVAAARDLEEAQVAQADAEAELYAFVESASSLHADLFQRGADARQKRVDDARDRVRELSSRMTAIPAGGSLINLWGTFSRDERREVLCGFLDSVIVRRGASGDLAGSVCITWADGSVANEEERVRVAAA